jgi:GNAT superfamily N-acetyltransferase
MRAVTVRLAQLGDLRAVLQLHKPDLRDDDAGVPTARQQETWARMLITEDLSVYVADDPEEGVIGTATMLTMPNLGYDCRPSAFIEAMVVAPGHRRRGVGRLLVQRALDDAGARGCHKIQLLTHKRHAVDGAHAFYRAMGFDPEAEGFRRYL